MTTEQIQSIRDELSKYHNFQWLGTERVGEVTHFKDVAESDGDLWVEFINGSRINYNLMDKYISKNTSPSEILDVTLEPSSKPITAKVQSKQLSPESPIHTLLKKQKENRVQIDLSIELNVPSPELHGVLLQSFDNAEAEIVSYALSDLNMEKVREAVTDAIKKYYSK